MTTPDASQSIPGALTHPDQLLDHYRAPSDLVLAKEIDHLDDGIQAFIAAATFCLLATAGADGRCDASPKGGDPGFVRVIDRHTLLIPDLNGNNRLDSLRNVIANPEIGLLFFVPERGETLRVNGRAWVSVDPDLLSRFDDTYRRPASVIAVRVTTAFIHCAKALRRGGIWQPDAWPSATTEATAAAEVPSTADLLSDHVGLDDATRQLLGAGLEASYDTDLQADRPDSAPSS